MDWIQSTSVFSHYNSNVCFQQLPGGMLQNTSVMNVCAPTTKENNTLWNLIQINKPSITIRLHSENLSGIWKNSLKMCDENTFTLVAVRTEISPRVCGVSVSYLLKVHNFLLQQAVGLRGLRSRLLRDLPSKNDTSKHPYPKQN